MGYVEIHRPDGTKIYLGLDSDLPAEVVFICDNCNEPKTQSQGSSTFIDGIDVMWVCDKCKCRNREKTNLTIPKDEDKND